MAAAGSSKLPPLNPVRERIDEECIKNMRPPDHLVPLIPATQLALIEPVLDPSSA